MKAGELREALKEIPYNTPIILSKDGEGNGFSGLWEVETVDWDSDWMEPIDRPDPNNKYHTKVMIFWPDN